jgi:hypothetical protein
MYLLRKYISNDKFKVCNKNKRMGASCGAGTAYLSGTPDFTPGV